MSEASLWRNIPPSPSSPLALLLCSTPLCPSFTPLPLLISLCYTARKTKSQHDFLSGSHFGSDMSSLRSAAASCLAFFFFNEAKWNQAFPPSFCPLLLYTLQNCTYSLTWCWPPNYYSLLWKCVQDFLSQSGNVNACKTNKKINTFWEIMFAKC